MTAKKLENSLTQNEVHRRHCSGVFFPVLRSVSRTVHPVQARQHDVEDNQVRSYP